MLGDNFGKGVICIKEDEEIIMLRTENSYLKDEIKKLSRYKLRYILNGMKDRCYNKSHLAYSYYGGRGIHVCKEWRGKNGFKNFYEWSIKNGWDPLLTIDRIDVNGDYSPENCRWVDWYVQARNRRDKKTSHYLELNGEVHTAAEWSRIRGWDPNIIYGRIRMGWSDERILTEEIAKKNPR